MIHIIVENRIDWAGVALEFQQADILDADGVSVKWSLAHSAKFPLKIRGTSHKEIKINILDVYEKALTAIKMQNVLDAVCKTTGIEAKLILGDSRKREHAYARFVIAWIAHHYLGYPITRIGRFLSGRDHTTILNGLRRFEGILDRDSETAKTLYASLLDLNRTLISLQAAEENEWVTDDRRPMVGDVVQAALQKQVLADLVFLKARFDGENWIDSHGEVIKEAVLGWRP